MMPRKFRAATIPCIKAGCRRFFKTLAGRTRHAQAAHPGAQQAPPAPPASPPPSEFDFNMGVNPVPYDEQHRQGQHQASPTPSVPSERMEETHPVLTGAPCDAAGRPLPPGAPPQPLPPKGPDDYDPFQSRPQFEVGDFLFRKEQMSAGNINELMQLWAATLPPGQDPPFADAKDMLNTIDSIPLADIPWQAFIVKYVGPRPARDPPPWMDKEYTVWFRCPRRVLHMQLSNSDFAAEMDYTPRRVYRGDEREYGDFMSGDWAWSQADTIGEDPEAAGAAFCPIILGSDKTTVSVATGQNEYYPLYLSNGLVHNSAWRAQRNAVSLVAFLSIPKTDRQYAKDPKFRKFRRQLFHTSLHTILQSLRPGMTKAEVVRCADGHFRRVIYGLGPYIADYPEQVLLSCVVQGWCAK
ncbi:hypothetical protein ONZ51_g13594 [Trametes cubensis]|uniref:C2H2-type domain-containing protein n=1 Tax=Trametes cubensis TaxID=1111947 RepID=A0AAD7X338_9APHY|nr:hypothetical protein ONZ51_g13594 [Trametes cubensis]